jgi:hypothetical protein
MTKLMNNQSKAITITHLGAETCITGFCYLIKLQPDHGGRIAILVDCGIAQGRTQKLIYELDRINTGVPVFIDSPQITRLYQEMDDSWDRGAGSSESPQIRT